MKVHITGKTYLESDNNQFILKRYSGKLGKNGEEIHTVLGYFSTIPQAIKKIYHLKVSDSTAKNLKELLEDHKRIVKEIEDMFKVDIKINE